MSPDPRPAESLTRCKGRAIKKYVLTDKARRILRELGEQLSRDFPAETDDLAYHIERRQPKVLYLKKGAG